MTTFSSRNRSTAIVPAPRSAIWDALSDPNSLASLTPLVSEIRASGDTWSWALTGISALGMTVAPTFTEQMTFEDQRHIGFRHDPPEAGGERAGANGHYDLADAPNGATRLVIDITICVELPLPKLSTRAVERVMATTMARTGDAFARNLYTRLGLDPARAGESVVSAS
ncbi:MAG: SRPBCC family protein [Acidimicrobiales bacterium]